MFVLLISNGVHVSTDVILWYPFGTRSKCCKRPVYKQPTLYFIHYWLMTVVIVCLSRYYFAQWLQLCFVARGWKLEFWTFWAWERNELLDSSQNILVSFKQLYEKNNVHGRQIVCAPFIMLSQIVYYMRKADVDMCCHWKSLHEDGITSYALNYVYLYSWQSSK
jgi:hypothetical protein